MYIYKVYSELYFFVSVCVCERYILKIICIYINKYINEKHIRTEHQTKTSIAESSNFLSKLFSMFSTNSVDDFIVL